MCNTRVMLKFQFNEVKTVPMREIFFGGCCKYSVNYIYFLLSTSPLSGPLRPKKDVL